MTNFQSPGLWPKGLETTVMDKSSWDTLRKRVSCISTPSLYCNHVMVSTELISTLKKGAGGFSYQQKRLFWNYDTKRIESIVSLKCVNSFVLDCSFEEIVRLLWMSHKHKNTFCTENELKCCMGLTLLSEDLQGFGCVSPRTHYSLP